MYSQIHGAAVIKFPRQSVLGQKSTAKLVPVVVPVNHDMTVVFSLLSGSL
jgi:hypothetical protein